MKPKYLFDKDKWLLGEHIPDCDIFFFQVPASCFNNDSSYSFIPKYKKFLGLYRKFALDFYVGAKDSSQVAEAIVRALIERPGFAKDLDRNIIRWSHELIDLSQRIAKLPLKNYSNKKLWELYELNDKVHTKLYTYGWLPVAVDLYHNNYTNKLKSYLYSVCDTKEEAEKAFILFTTPVRRTIVADDREEFLKIYERFKKFLKRRQVPEALKQALKNHADKWGHFGYIYAGNVPPFGPDHYLNELWDLTANNTDGKKLLAQESLQLKINARRQRQLYKRLRISPLYRRLFTAAQDFALSKLIRRHAQLTNLYLLHQSLLPEVAKRLSLTRYQVQFMLKDEVREALLRGRVDKREFSQRLTHCAYYAEKGIEKVYLGATEQKLRKLAETKVDKNIRELTGQTAQPGFARGKVKLIFRAKDMVKFNVGDILVSVATDPDVVPAMKKAAAIVTEQGGITSHAAIVSRELGIPCIIGTKIATQVFKDGDMVEVDASKGTVKIIK